MPIRSHSKPTLNLLTGGCNVGFHHFARIDNAVKFLFADKPELQGGILEREIVVESVVGDL
jgi:hypothetical protein